MDAAGGWAPLQDTYKPPFKGLGSFAFLLNCFDKIFSHNPLHLTLNLIRHNLQLIIAQKFLAPHGNQLIRLTLSLPIQNGGKMVSLTFDLSEVGPRGHWSH